MPDVTDPEAIRFVSEQIRPLCEAARALNVRIDAMTTAWFAGLNADFPNDSSAVDDGREDEGVSRLTGANVNSAVGNLIAMKAASNSEILSLPCVRPLDVN
jgi:hypothetical protein